MRQVQLDMFRRDHPELKPVEECEHEPIIRWAAVKGYIVLREFEGKKFYTEEQLDMAIMWAEKEEVCFP